MAMPVLYRSQVHTVTESLLLFQRGVIITRVGPTTFAIHSQITGWTFYERSQVQSVFKEMPLLKLGEWCVVPEMVRNDGTRVSDSITLKSVQDALSSIGSQARMRLAPRIPVRVEPPLNFGLRPTVKVG